MTEVSCVYTQTQQAIIPIFGSNIEQYFQHGIEGIRHFFHVISILHQPVLSKKERRLEDQVYLSLLVLATVLWDQCFCELYPTVH